MASNSDWESLNVDGELFEHLKSSPPAWWIDLKSNPNIVFQIRADNTIDVFLNGGGIITGLKWNKRYGFSGNIDPAYVPLLFKNKTVKYIFDGNSIDFEKICPEVMPLGRFDAGKIKQLEDSVRRIFPKESEKAIQHSFLVEDKYLIDAEIQSFDSRIDLVRIDINIKKLVFFELKTIGDPRLYKDENKKESIKQQLRKYCKLIKANQEQILCYFDKIIQIKKKLGLLSPEMEQIHLSDGYSVLEKPILLFGDCTQKWIDLNEPTIKERIKPYAYGAFYFGGTDTNLNIPSKEYRNKKLYI